MDVGIFKTSGLRLKLWIIIPPLLMVSVGLGSHAWRQRAVWKLQETQALSEFLPPLITARKDVAALFDSFKGSTGSEMGSGDQLISFLQDMAQLNDFMLDTIDIVDRRNSSPESSQALPVLNAVVRGRGDFTSVQMYINEAKSRQQLLSVDSLRVNKPSDGAGAGIYDVEIVFELMQLNEMKTVSGGGIR